MFCIGRHDGGLCLGVVGDGARLNYRLAYESIVSGRRSNGMSAVLMDKLLEVGAAIDPDAFMRTRRARRIDYFLHVAVPSHSHIGAPAVPL
jgi:hypothetical protein